MRFYGAPYSFLVSSLGSGLGAMSRALEPLSWLMGLQGLRWPMAGLRDPPGLPVSFKLPGANCPLRARPAS